MNAVSIHANDDGTTETERMTETGITRSEPDSIATVESYETEESVVFYDAENPLAWVETTRTLTLEELA